MDKYEVAQILREIATFIELTDQNPKKSIAYRRAANSIELSDNFYDLLTTNSLEKISGVGKTISRMIYSLIKKEKLKYYNKLKEIIPNSLLELVHIPGLNIKKIRILYEQLNIKSIDDLKNAIEKNKIQNIKGFTPLFLKKLEINLKEHLSKGNLLLYSKAHHLAEILKTKLSESTTQIEICGDLRRKCEVINEIILLACTTNQDSCRNLLINHNFIQNIIVNEESIVKVLLKQGIIATLQFVKEENFPTFLLKLTGNEQHLKDLAAEAAKKRISLDRTFPNEISIYQSLNLNFIPPELREGYGEVHASKHTNFSDLITQKDLKGTFHCHTLDSDGTNTLEELVEAAKKLEWHYLGISDHSKSSHQANGLSEERLISQIEQIKKLNKILCPNFKIFSGLECDILKDGQLDFTEEILKELDFVIVSIHSLFKQEKEIMTNRLIKAIENPYTTMIGHLSGRLLRLRNPYQFDIDKIIDACIANDKIIELNAYPNRLDMDWRFWIKAKERGLKCSINPDAHSISDLNYCFYGVDIARKGWIKKKNVINTLSLKEIINFLKIRKPS